MAYLTQISTSTLNNQNINVALLVHTFTNTTRIRKVWFDVFVTDIVGGGDYTAYITRQKAGAGVWYESIKTTKAVGVGIISVMFNSKPLTINATDVVRIYVLGLAGDNVNAVDIITEVNEEWIDIDANGRVDVGEWLGSIPAGLSTNGYVQSMLMRWLTDNAAGTPSALSAGLVQAYHSALVGITLLANWLRGLARKDAMNAAAKAELNAGGGAYDETTDSQEAIADAIVPGAPVNVNVEETDIVVNP